MRKVKFLELFAWLPSARALSLSRSDVPVPFSFSFSPVGSYLALLFLLLTRETKRPKAVSPTCPTSGVSLDLNEELTPEELTPIPFCLRKWSRRVQSENRGNGWYFEKCKLPQIKKQQKLPAPNSPCAGHDSSTLGVWV